MKLTHQFNTKNSDILKDAQGNTQALETVRKIEERRITLEQKLEQHIQKYRNLWITREAEKQHAQENRQLQYNLPQPQSFSVHNNYWNNYIHQATRVIDARIEARMQSLDTISRRMQSDAIHETIDQQKHQQLARQRLNQEVREIHQSTNRRRMDVYHDFENNKVQRVEEARRNNSSTPERDVYAAYQQQERNILADQEHQLRQAYEKHGFNYEMEQHALTVKFRQKL